MAERPSDKILRNALAEAGERVDATVLAWARRHTPTASLSDVESLIAAMSSIAKDLCMTGYRVGVAVDNINNAKNEKVA